MFICPGKAWSRNNRGKWVYKVCRNAKYIRLCLNLWFELIMPVFADYFVSYSSVKVDEVFHRSRHTKRSRKKVSLITCTSSDRLFTNRANRGSNSRSRPLNNANISSDRIVLAQCVNKTWHVAFSFVLNLLSILSLLTRFWIAMDLKHLFEDDIFARAIL